MKTMFIDVMLHERYVFTLRYRYSEKSDLKQINDKILSRKPSLQGKPYVIFID